MQRFDDFLKLLLGLLVTQIVREAHPIGKNLGPLFCNSSTWIGEALPYCYMVFLLRNVHASINYDRQAGNGQFVTVLERTMAGRFTVFVFTVLTLVVSPLVILDVLRWHAPPEGTVCGADAWYTNLVAAGLFVPFVLYLVWDVIIWLSSEVEQAPPRHARVEYVIRRWVLLDAIALGVGLLVLARSTVVENKYDLAERYRGVLELFMFLSIGTVLGDYWLNRKFYFGDGSETAEAAGRARC